MKQSVLILTLLGLFVGPVSGEGGFPTDESPSSDSAAFTGKLLFVETTYGNDRALLCKYAEVVPRDYSTCINLSGTAVEQLSPIARCVELRGIYTPYSSGLIYTGSVGKEFGMLNVVDFKSHEGC